MIRGVFKELPKSGFETTVGKALEKGLLTKGREVISVRTGLRYSVVKFSDFDKALEVEGVGQESSTTRLYLSDPSILL